MNCVLSDYFQNTRRPYQMTLAGEQFYVITSPGDVAATYKKTDSLIFDMFVRDMMLNFGISPYSVEKMWQVPSENERGAYAQVPYCEQKCLAHLFRSLHKNQLHQGENQRVLTARFRKFIGESLRWENLPSGSTREYVLASSGPSKRISLKGCCADILMSAATRAFFGDAITQRRPDLFRQFYAFDDDSWMLMYKYPRFLASSMYKGRDEANDALEQYFESPKENPQGEAWFVRVAEDKQRELGIGNRDIATSLLMVYWVCVTAKFLPSQISWISAYSSLLDLP